MVRGRKYTEDILARINFPLFTVQILNPRYVLVGGGGGTAKTGIANGFEIFELSHDGSKFVAEEVTRHETGGNVVMYCSTFTDNKRSYVVAGQEDHCQLYYVNSELVCEDKVENIDHVNEARQRKSKGKTDRNKNLNKRLKFAMKPGDSIRTDFNGPEPLSRVARIHHNGKLMATGGTDGHIRLWKFPSLQPLTELKAHEREIDDIDFSQHGNFLVTVAKDGLGIVWDCVKGKEYSRLIWKQPEGSKYLYKRCRFGVIEGDDKISALYTITNPTGVAKKQKSFLQQWLPEDGLLKKVAEFDECLSALAVRDDGRFVAVGTMFSGSVSIYASFSLQIVKALEEILRWNDHMSSSKANISLKAVCDCEFILTIFCLSEVFELTIIFKYLQEKSVDLQAVSYKLKVLLQTLEDKMTQDDPGLKHILTEAEKPMMNIAGAHSMFVTGLEFFPVLNESRTICSVAEAAVLSISVDNHVCIHTLPYRRTMPLWVGMVILIFTLFLSFTFCSYIGL